MTYDLNDDVMKWWELVSELEKVEVIFLNFFYIFTDWIIVAKKTLFMR